MNKLPLLLLALLATSPASLAAPIDPKLAFAFSENADWINFAPTHGGVDIAADGLSGFAWGENIGWIKLGSDAGPPYANSNANDWGVNNDGLGNLTGFAWSETAGWINFNSSDSSVMVDPTDNSLLGFAWAENLGWIRFDGKVFGTIFTCNVNIVSGVTEYFETSYEACEILALGPDFIAADGSNVSVNSGWEIDFLPGFIVEQGATLNANVCGQSLCTTSDSPMPDGCHSCVTQICAIDATCCTVDFDAACLGMVSSECGLVCD